MTTIKWHLRILAMDTMNPSLGTRIRAARKARGLRREHIAVGINKCAETVARIERDQTPPTTDDLMIIAEMLGVPAPALLTGEGFSAPEAA